MAPKPGPEAWAIVQDQTLKVHDSGEFGWERWRRAVSRFTKLDDAISATALGACALA